MIEYLENLLGVDTGFLTSTDWGITLSLVLAAALIIMVFRCVLIWFEKIFQR